MILNSFFLWQNLLCFTLRCEKSLFNLFSLILFSYCAFFSIQFKNTFNSYRFHKFLLNSISIYFIVLASFTAIIFLYCFLNLFKLLSILINSTYFYTIFLKFIKNYSILFNYNICNSIKYFSIDLKTFLFFRIIKNHVYSVMRKSFLFYKNEIFLRLFNLYAIVSIQFKNTLLSILL